MKIRACVECPGCERRVGWDLEIPEGKIAEFEPERSDQITECVVGSVEAITDYIGLRWEEA